MARVLRHAVLPSIAPLLIVGLFFTPVDVFGCATRGLMALGIALLSALLAFVAVGRGLYGQRKGDPMSSWWVLSAAILTLPLALLLGPLG